MATTQTDPLFPWQQNLGEHCLALIRKRQLPPALLVHGEHGFGLARFVRWLANAVLCRSEHDRPCGQCSSCRLIRTRDHPDLLLIQPRQEQDVLKIAQVRAMTDFVSVTTHYGRKVVLMLRAEQMNTAAANALLKTLEEPPEYATIILACHFPSLLPPTIRSRCQRLHFDILPRAEMVNWLQRESGREKKTCDGRLEAASGMPLTALEALCAKNDERSEREKFLMSVQGFLEGHGDLTQLSADWEKTPTAQVQNWLLEMVETEIRSYFTGSSGGSIDLLFKLHEQQKRRCHPRNNNLTPRLLLEKALYEMEFAIARPRSALSDRTPA